MVGWSKGALCVAYDFVCYFVLYVLCWTPLENEMVHLLGISVNKFTYKGVDSKSSSP